MTFLHRNPLATFLRSAPYPHLTFIDDPDPIKKYVTILDILDSSRRAADRRVPLRFKPAITSYRISEFVTFSWRYLNVASEKKLSARRLSLTVNFDDCPGFVCSRSLKSSSATICHRISPTTYVDVLELPGGSALVSSSGSVKSSLRLSSDVVSQCLTDELCAYFSCSLEEKNVRKIVGTTIG